MSMRMGGRVYVDAYVYVYLYICVSITFEDDLFFVLLFPSLARSARHLPSKSHMTTLRGSTPWSLGDNSLLEASEYFRKYQC